MNYDIKFKLSLSQVLLNKLYTDETSILEKRNQILEGARVSACICFSFLLLYFFFKFYLTGFGQLVSQLVRIKSIYLEREKVN
jgi:hypothetical protein